MPEELVGRQIERIRRVFYVHGGVTSVGDGAVEVAVSGGAVRLYEVAGNG